MRGVVEKQLIECLRAKTTRTKTPVLAIIFKVLAGWVIKSTADAFNLVQQTASLVLLP